MYWKPLIWNRDGNGIGQSRTMGVSSLPYPFKIGKSCARWQQGRSSVGQAEDILLSLFSNEMAST